MKKIEESIEEMKKMSEFQTKYQELFEHLINLSRQLRISAIEVDDIKLSGYWIAKYPFLYKDMQDIGISNRLLGFNLK